MNERLRCREFVAFLADYLEGRLPVAQVRAFEEHLSRCPPCVTYAETYAQGIFLGRVAFSAGDAPVPDDVPEDLLRAILRARSAQP